MHVPSFDGEPAIAVWLADPDWLLDEEAAARVAPLLDSEESERAERMIAVGARREFLVGRQIVRRGLSRYGGAEPEAWRFVKNEHGRPAVSRPALQADLRFNLSHTRGLAAVGFVGERELGVDVEALDRKFDFLPIARRKFSTTEAERVVAAEGEARRELFFRYWTLKEAFLKAKGVGLTLPLDRFSFDFVGGGIVEACFEAPLPDRPEDWHFALYGIGARHRLAVAVESRGGDALPLELRWERRPDGRVPTAEIRPIARSAHWPPELLPGFR